RWLNVLSVCARRRRRGPGWAGSAGAFSALTMFAGLQRALIALRWYGGGGGGGWGGGETRWGWGRGPERRRPPRGPVSRGRSRSRDDCAGWGGHPGIQRPPPAAGGRFGDGRAAVACGHDLGRGSCERHFCAGGGPVDRCLRRRLAPWGERGCMRRRRPGVPTVSS